MAENRANGLTQQNFSQKQPLVSVIIPCYNAEKYVEQAVRSIMNQTYKNLEILITDDCSTDGSFAILQKLAEEDARIKLFRNTENKRIVRTLNALVERASGKYIARMDADDISLAKRIEKQVAFLEANPCIAFCGTNAWHIDERDRVLSFSHLPLTNNDIQSYKFLSNPFYHPSVLIRRDALGQNPYDENFLYVEDYALWMKILDKGKGVNLRRHYLYYRILGSSISHSSQTNTIQSERKNLIQKDSCDFADISDSVVLGSLIYSSIKLNGFSKTVFFPIRNFFSFICFILTEFFLRIVFRGRKIHV